MDTQALFATIDRMDAPAFASFLTPDGTFRMGSNPPVAGRAAVEAFVGGFWAGIDGSRHSDLRVYEAGASNVFVEGTVTYRLKNGREVPVPFLNRFRMEGDLIAEYLIYLDPTSVAAVMAE